MLDRLRFRTLQTGMLLFWSLWTTLVVLTNVTDALKRAGALPPDFRWVSGNFAFISATTAAQYVPAVFNVVLYAGVLLWEGLAAYLMWQAFTSFRRDGDGSAPVVERAFTVSIALWAAFLLASEGLVAYGVEATHMRIMVAQLVTVLVVRGVTVAARTESDAERGVAAG